MATKIFKGKSKEVADLLIQLCEKYYEGSSLERTSSSVTIESNLENDFMDPINFTCFGYEGIMDRLYASETGDFLIEVTAPLSDWYIDRYFKDEEEDQAYSDFNDYGGDYMSFSDAIRCVIERRNLGFRYDGDFRAELKSLIDEKILKRFDEIFAYDCDFIEYKEILFDEDDEDYDE